MAEILPPPGPDAKVIETYTARGFRISKAEYLGAVVVVADQVLPLEVKALPELQAKHLSMLDTFEVSYLIVGTPKPVSLPFELITALKAKGIVPEVMELGAACRTYNVLRTEGRQVAAALIP